jgi:hypothetical protein
MAILTPAPINFRQQIRSEVAEALRLNFSDIYPTALHMRVTMASPNAATLPAPQLDTYRIPGDYTLVVGEMRAHIALNELSSEVVSTGLLSSASIDSRIICKAMNARVTLVNPDRENLKVVETVINNSANPTGLSGTLSLASLMPAAGGAPARWIGDGDAMPLLFPGNERVQLRVSLTEAETGLLQTEYGVVLLGAFIRSRGS